jgi:sirohydrochlorin cobaltochelatase
MKGLLEVESIRNLWVEHTRAAETLEDYYHSMFPEE